MRVISVAPVSPPVGNPSEIPIDGLMSLGILANKVGGNPDALGAKFEAAGFPVERIGRGWGAVPKRALAVVFGDARARSLLYGLETELVDAGVAGDILGVAGGESIPLCERRGVVVDRTLSRARASRTGCIYLRKILEYERTFTLPEADWVDARIALPRIRDAQATVISGGVPDWQDQGIDYSDPSAPRVNPYGEVSVRARWSAIRCARPAIDRRTVSGPLRCPRFDLYRLLGIAWPGADIATYRAWIAEAHEAVLGTAAAPTPAPGLELETKVGR